MADQASVNRLGTHWPNGPSSSQTHNGGNMPRSSSQTEDDSASSVVTNVAGFGENLLTLAELQARLTAIELRQNIEAVKSGGALLLASVVIFLATLPIWMVGIAELLVSEVGMKRGYALLTVGLISVAIAVGCALMAQTWLRRKPFGFPVAAEEFSRNINWLRTVLRQSGRWPSSR